MPQERRVINGYIVERQPDGTLVTIGPANQMPTDPAYPYQGQQAQADVQNRQASTANTAVDTEVTRATAPSTVSTANLPPGYRWVDPTNPAAGAEVIPGTPQAREAGREAISSNASAAADLLRIIDGPEGLQSIYDSEFMNNGMRSLGEYTWGGLNQSEALANLEAQSRAALPLVRRFSRTPGEGSQDARENQMLVDLLPDPNARDSANQRRIENMRQSALSVLEQEGIDTSTYDPSNENMRGSVWAQQRVVARDPQLQASQGNTTSVPINPEMQQEYQSWVLANIGSDNFTPQAYDQMRRALDRQYGYESGSGYEDEGTRILEDFRNGGTLNLSIPPLEQEMTGTQQFRNDVANSGIGAALIGAADAGGFGGVSALAPERMAALRNERPNAMMLGEIGGSVGGTAMLGRLGRETFGRAVPQAMANSGGSQFGRNLATDVAYSGVYGGMTGQNPLESMAWGAAGSSVGQGAGRLAGAAARGVQPSRAVEYLRSRNIPLTTGQTVGGVVNRAEERAMSIPFVGDMIRNRRMEGINAFNRTAFDDAGQPIGATIADIGLEGVEELGNQVSDAYTQATSGVQVPLDQQFLADFQQVGNMGNMLPRPERRRLGQILDARIQPLADAGMVTGETFQQAQRGLRSARNSNPSQFAGFEDFYRDAVTATEDALTNQMMRGGGSDVVEGIQSANAANRNLRTIEDAANRARAGSVAETPYVFSPYQLQTAGAATQRRFPGARPFAELADAGQEVLPNRVPNSGTADRAMQAALPALATGGAGLGYLNSGDAEGAATGAAIPTLALALAALGGTRGGQRFINQAVTRRPDQMRRLGDWAVRRSGLFGTAAMAPVVVGQQ